MKPTVIVFARAPRLGGVKRRLAREIGDRAALRFHTATLMALVRDLKKSRVSVVVALTPDRARVRLPVPVIPQGQGGLGRRMTRVLGQYRRVALIGCDIPEAGSADVRAAFRLLGTNDAVFGPASDGGYWLIALGPRRPSDLFGAARWSSEHALTDTLKQFRHHRVGMLRILSDVDTKADHDRAALCTFRPGRHNRGA